MGFRFQEVHRKALYNVVSEMMEPRLHTNETNFTNYILLKLL